MKKLAKSFSIILCAVLIVGFYGGCAYNDSKAEEFLARSVFPKYELTEGEIFYLGRWFDKDIGGIKHKVTVNGGSQLFFMTEGASCVKINCTVITEQELPFLAYSVDGGEYTRCKITDACVLLPDREFHTVRVVVDSIDANENKWEKECGVAICSVVPDRGKLRAIKPKNKKIIFYGDSITEGGRVLSMDGTSRGMSVTNAYPRYCAEKLKGIECNVGYCASGMLVSGSFAPCLQTIDYMSQNRYYDNSFQPDLIVINHGTNDIFYGSPEFRDAYRKVLLRLQKKYFGKPIVCMIPFNQKHSNDIRIVSSEFDNCYIVETQNWDLTYTDGLHPDLDGSKKAGINLARELIQIFGKEFFINYSTNLM